MKHRQRRSKSRIATRRPKGFFPTLGWLWSVKIRPHITKKRVIIASVVMLLVLISLPIATYAYFARDIGNKDRLMNRNNTGIILKDRNGKPFYSSGVRSSEDDLTLNKISDDMEKTLIAAEDKNFYEHNGFSTRGILRSLFGNITSGDATGSGGSTITQQLVKNKLLSSSQNYLRKYQEVSMAVAVERKYSKNEILTMYLNSVYFGEGAFGISDAARTYFNKPASDLNLAESSMLVGLLPAPSTYSPIRNPDLAKRSQTNVLRKMVANQAITEQQRDEILAIELSYAAAASKDGSDSAHHFAEMLIDQLNEKYGEEKVTRSGFEVTTTIDLDKQRKAEEIVRTHIAGTESRGGRNAGMVAIDPKTGQIVALVGSVDYFNQKFGQVNMALALRQPGSSFKPIYFAEALDRGLITPATIIEDKQTDFGGGYSPKNFDNRFKGPMPVRNALAESRNIPAVTVLQKLGLSRAASAAQRMGLDTVKDTSKYGLSMALGTAEVRLLDMTNAYAAFANGGKQFEPVTYTSIVDKYGKKIDDAPKQDARQVVSPEASFLTSSILSDTSARAPTFGSSLNISGKNTALKTGTTNDNKDAWTIGYTPSMAIGVWLGNNENESMRGIAGGSGAGALWKKVMTEYLKGQRREEFTKPSGVKSIAICQGTDKRAADQGGANIKNEFFKANYEPKEECDNRPQQQPEPAPVEPDANSGTGNDDDEDDATTPTNPGGGTQGPNPGTGTGGNPGTGGGGGTTPRPNQPTTPRTPTQP